MKPTTLKFSAFFCACIHHGIYLKLVVLAFAAKFMPATLPKTKKTEQLFRKDLEEYESIYISLRARPYPS